MINQLGSLVQAAKNAKWVSEEAIKNPAVTKEEKAMFEAEFIGRAAKVMRFTGDNLEELFDRLA